MAPRLYCPLLLQTGAEVTLPAHAARHVQVLRLQPGDAVALFHGGLSQDGSDTGWEPGAAAALAAAPAATTGWFDATITRMGRSEVCVHIGNWHAPPAPRHAPVHIACGVPANERMDWLVEKAAELGVATIQPLLMQRSVMRLRGERAQKRVAHWQAIAVSACEQSGRTAVPWLRPLLTLDEFLQQAPSGAARWLLSLQEHAQPLLAAIQGLPVQQAVCLLSGPEGGMSPDEESLLQGRGWEPVSLGDFTLRAETAPLVALAALGVCRPSL